LSAFLCSYSLLSLHDALPIFRVHSLRRVRDHRDRRDQYPARPADLYSEKLMATPLLEARDISKRFGRLQALDRVSIALPRGRTLALVGDNGAGKSTLIKILAGLHQPDSGEIWFEHRRVR